MHISDYVTLINTNSLFRSLCYYPTTLIDISNTFSLYKIILF